LANALSWAGLWLCAAAAFGEPPGSGDATRLLLGPAQIRDGHPLAQARLTLPSVSPRPVERGRWEIQTAILWSNSFSWSQDVPGEHPLDRQFLVDGETGIFEISVRRGLSARADLGLRIVANERGGGTLDGFIDGWHELLDLPAGNRPDFLRDAFRVEGRTKSGAPFAWNRHDGFGLGGVELDGRYLFADGGQDRLSAAVVGRVHLPTGTGPYEGDGFGAGVQLALQAPLGRRVGLFTGVGATAQDEGPVRGVEYEAVRGHAYAAIEWRVAGALSLIGETNIATRLVANIQSYPGTHWLVNVGGRVTLGGRTRLDVFVTENILSQLTTTDVALFVGVAVRP
jgi:hypothetical protein